MDTLKSFLKLEGKIQAFEYLFQKKWSYSLFNFIRIQFFNFKSVEF